MQAVFDLIVFFVNVVSNGDCVLVEMVEKVEEVCCNCLEV